MLTDTRVRSAKSGERPVKLSDGGGLHLLIQPHGTKLWRFAYRFLDKQKTLALGVYPTIGLQEARQRRQDAKRLLAKGVDPSVERQLDKARARAGQTFGAVAEELLSKLEREGRAAVTLDKKRWLLGFALPAIGDRLINEITAPQLLSVIRSVEARGHYETARRLRSTCGMVFRYAIATSRAERDPAADLHGALITPKVIHRAAITDPTGIGGLLRAIDGFEGTVTVQSALRLAPLVFVRPGELRFAEWQELDLDAAEWKISASKMKMRRPHRVPLSRQALAVVRELRSFTGTGQWLFPSIRSSAKPISENTLNAALRRLGYSSEEMSAHGFRAMASARLNEMGRWNPDAIERQLAHQEEDSVRRAYVHAAEYWQERVKMMQAWADYLDQLREGGKVVSLPRAV
jgi:integrase